MTGPIFMFNVRTFILFNAHQKFAPYLNITTSLSSSLFRRSLSSTLYLLHFSINGGISFGFYTQKRSFDSSSLISSLIWFSSPRSGHLHTVFVSIPCSDECTSVLGSFVNLGEQPTSRLVPRSAELAFRAVLKVDYVLTTDLPSDPPATTSAPFDPESSTGPSATIVDQVKKDLMIDLNKYAKDNKTIRGHLLNHMSDPMFDLKGRPNQKPTPQANLAKQDDEVIAIVVEVNLIENKTNWILNTGVSRHFCTNQELLHDYGDTTNGEYVFMGNLATTEVIGKAKVILKLTSGKSLSLNNVLYVSSLHRNLVFGSLLNRAGLKIVLEGGKVVLTKNEKFVNKGLGDVNFVSIRKLEDLRLINTSESHETGKCLFVEKSNGIVHEFIAPYSPQQNDIAEWKNRITIKEMMNVMLLSSGLPDNMWREVVLSARFCP
ncbi:ty1-copia retrotransposon protein [Cucumis melo var. makuwa]|uniref:Ty1-copia retrotransposon protein n=1 Tax=Cucumis melo var. makuwa TaxID=1194695 RepID=A0A5A7SX23_CUCMM|nr:ty1-copia retrotransposon protein [Cucumis melo var. makuwa]TYK30966.1 ty1-copia retrotransposon protein [Cucumis melo var. makuwa]